MLEISLDQCVVLVRISHGYVMCLWLLSDFKSCTSSVDFLLNLDRVELQWQLPPMLLWQL